MIPQIGRVEKSARAVPQRDPQSLVVVPIFLDGKVYGVVSAEQDRIAAFDEHDQRLLETLVLQASQAVQNARLLQKERALWQQAETLREVSTAISSALELKEVAARILGELGKVVEYRKASMQLIRGDVRELITYRGFTEKTVSKWLLRPISEDRLISRIVANRKPLILSDPSEDPDWEIVPETADVKSWIGLPLVYGGKVLGLLTLDHDQLGYYTEAMEGLLVLFANPAAVAIENARLFDDAQRRIRDLEIANDVVQTISTKLDTRDLQQTIVSQIADRLNCTHCTLFFPQTEDDEFLLVPRVSHGPGSDRVMSRRFKLDEGLVGWVFQHGKSLVLADARADSRFAPAREERDQPRSMLVAPIKVGGRTVGVISADQDKYGWFSEGDRCLVDTLAQQAGIAIERAAGLELLQDIGNRIIGPQKVISPRKVDEILEQVVSGAIRLTSATSGVIYLVSEDGKSVNQSFQFPADFNHPPPRMEREEGLTRHVVATGEMLIFPDIHQDARVNPILYDRIWSMIAIPLKLVEKVIGVLYLNYAKPHDFTEIEISLLSTLASQAAIAVQNARLFEQLQEELLQTKAFYEIGQAFSAELDYGKVLKLILERAKEIIPFEYGTITLIDEQRERLVHLGINNPIVTLPTPCPCRSI